MELIVRDARATDVTRIADLLASRQQLADGGPDVSGAADLLRQLVDKPNASILVAVRGRELVGAAMVSLRPSVRAGGLVGTIDLLTIATGTVDGVEDALLAETVRSARNKGCVVVEAEQVADGTGELWTRSGFTETRPRWVLGPVPHRSPA